MRSRLSIAVAFLCGSIFSLVLLVRCGGSISSMQNKMSGDSGPTMPMSGDSGSTMAGDSGSMMGMSNAMADAYTSGSRLKLQSYKAADGAISFAGWHDTQLNVSCQFSRASDGQTRCIPSGQAFVEPTALFSDAGCTAPAAFDTCAAAGVNYALIVGNASCSSGSAVYALGQTLTLAQVYSGSPASCASLASVSSAATTYANYTFWAVGAVLDPSMFVSATLETD